MSTHITDEKLDKKIQHKKFLKTNELLNMTAASVGVVQQYKVLFMALVLLLVALGVGAPTLKWYRMQQVEAFNQKFYEAQKSLKKEDAYRGLLQEYANIPAVQMARLKLVDEMIDHKEIDDALKVVDAGFAGANRDIFSTLLVLKAVDILKQQSKIADAVQYAASHEKNVIETFLPQFKIMQADLLVLANKKEDARKIYQELSSFGGFSAQQDMISGRFDANTANEAKEKLLLLDLGRI